MNQDLFQLVYVSKTTSEFEYEKDISSILNSSQKNNETLGITGMLFYKGGIFLQYLEGPQESLHKLYDEKIANDSRHSGCKLLLKQPVLKRLFDGWEMKYCQIDDVDLEMVNAVLKWNQAIAAANSGAGFQESDVLNMVSDLKRAVEDKSA